MSLTHKISIIILNYNGKRFLKECLDSIFKQSYEDYQVILVDNGSADDSVGFVKRRYIEEIKSDRLKIITNDENRGFSEGSNIGIKDALKNEKPEYILTLNNDTVVDRNFLKELVGCAQRHKEAGSIMPKMIWSLNPKLIDSAGIMYSKNTLPFARGKFEPIEKYNREEEIFGCCAGACLYRTEALEAVATDGEFFDEDFFAYCEDVDLAFRLAWAGWKTYFCPEAIVYHYGGGTGGVISDLTIYYRLRNSTWVAIKNLPKGFIIKNLHWIIVADIASVLYDLVFRRRRIAIKAKIDAYSNLCKVFEKRRKIKRIVDFKQIEKFFIMKWWPPALPARVID